MATKLLSARASLRTALQAPPSSKFLPANDPDADKFGKKKMSKQTAPGKASLGWSLREKF